MVLKTCMMIRDIPVGKLKPAPWNPRRISQRAFGKLKRSLQSDPEFLRIRPILADKSGMIYAGNMRFRAAVDLGWKTVPAVLGIVGVRLAKKRALIDNNQWGEWVDDELTELLHDLGATSADAIADLGFDLHEVDRLTRMIGMDDDEDDPVPEPPSKAISKTGDLWQCGDHRVLCGDSTKREDVERVMKGDRATLLFTDPPYGVAIGAKNRMLNSFQPAGRNLQDIASDTISCDDLKTMLLYVFNLCREIVCADDCSVFVCSPQGGELGLMMMMMMQEAGLKIRHVLNWVKNSPTFSLGRLDYEYQHEPILFTWTQKHKRRKGGEFHTSIWNVDKPRASKHHPTMKPVELVVNAALNHTDAGDICYDPFLGSGTTLIACEQLGRKCRAIEIEPCYVDVAVARWQAETGKRAKNLTRKNVVIDTTIKQTP